MRSFADLPTAVERLLTGGERDRVGVVLLDAFGRRFAERHADHPFLRRLRIEPVQSMFPSTTTAHVTTMHTGRAVGEHGLYEWHMYEPSVDSVVIPLRAAGVDPAALVDGDTLYQRLAAAGVPSTVLSPAAFSPSRYDRAFNAGARIVAPVESI